MRKLRLTVDELTVESFPTGPKRYWGGTVEGLACDTRALDCTMGNPCPSDVENTLHAVTCANPTDASCEENTNFATTCRATGRCCDGWTQPTDGTGTICCP